jgi:hypothetical protein
MIAQQYLIKVETTQCKLYMGYINRLSARSLLRVKDTVNQVVVHAKASGAEIDYDSDGRMQVIPYQKYGSIDIYVEVLGKFHYAGRINFEGVKPPPSTDGTFREVMGITKDNPQTNLRSKKHFDTESKSFIKSTDVTLGGFPFNNLEPGKLNILIVSRIYIKDTTKADPYIPQPGIVDILSSDARVRKISDDTFGVTPLSGKSRCKVTFFLDGRKIEDEVWSVH